MTYDPGMSMPPATSDTASWYRGHYHQYLCSECFCPRVDEESNPVRDCCEDHLCMCHWEGP